ncbi:MAG TPA: sensor histidine kinase [Anaerolineales bacterium]|nr:sensor histidine kinase [Anaerolineales bacterium]
MKAEPPKNSDFLLWLQNLGELSEQRNESAILHTALQKLVDGLNASLTEPLGTYFAAVFSWYPNEIIIHSQVADPALPDEISQSELEVLMYEFSTLSETSFWEKKLAGWDYSAWAVYRFSHYSKAPSTSLLLGVSSPHLFTPLARSVFTSIGKLTNGVLHAYGRYQRASSETLRSDHDENEARKRLASDLHDGPAQQVAAMTMRANFAKRQIERNPQKAFDEIQKIEEMGRQTTKDMRMMLFMMRPLVLETRGLSIALQSLADRVQDGFGLNVMVEYSLLIEQVLSERTQSMLFQIVEEAVKNVTKHAAAANIWIRALLSEKEFVLEVEDDGVGFNLGELRESYDMQGSLGMVTMRERAELAGGELRVESTEGHGTIVQVVVPIQLQLSTEMYAEAMRFHS